MSEFIFAYGYWFHTPCACLEVFPFRGKMIPSTIMLEEEKIWRCEVCGITAREQVRIIRRKEK